MSLRDIHTLLGVMRAISIFIFGLFKGTVDYKRIYNIESLSL